MAKKKDKKVSVKKIEIRIEGGLYAYARLNRPSTIVFFTPKGQRIDFINNYFINNY